jgi:uncharacterized phage infection (PIP) family protein YhgE
MRNLLAIVVIFTIAVFACIEAHAFDVVSVDSKIKELQSTLENQIERLKDARERAGTRMDLAKIRVAEELRRSQEDLQIQVESLSRLREQLSEQRSLSNQALEQAKNDWAQRLESAFASIESQLAQTNQLINRMETLKQSFDADTETASNVSIGPLTITTSPPPIATAPPVTTTPAPVEPATPTVPATEPAPVQPVTPTTATPPSGST